jgi:type IV secretion system protein VirB5
MSMKKIIKAVTITAALLGGQQAFAGIPVIDGVSNGMRIAEFAQTVVQWGKEIAEMQAQYQQMVTQYESMNGARGWGSVNQNDYGYVDGDWQSVLGNVDYSDYLEAAKIAGIEDAAFSSESEAAEAMQNMQNQNAFNRAMTEEGFNKTQQRLSNLEALAAQVNSATEAKDIADLQARIQAEQVLLQNEQNKMIMMAQLQQNQRDIAEQQDRERLMKMSNYKRVDW